MRPIEIAKSAVQSRYYELIKSFFGISLITFSLSVLSFLAMHTFKSNIAGWSAVIFGFIAIITMMIPGIKKLRADRITKSKA
ncbi:MAG: hypothetical protein ACREBA_09805 [Nitrosotalea sp.]